MAKSAVTYWVIAVEGESLTEEVSERKLGRVIDSTESDGSTVTVNNNTRKSSLHPSSTNNTGSSKTKGKAVRRGTTAKVSSQNAAAVNLTLRKTTRSTRRSGEPVELLAGIEHIPATTKKTTSKRKFQDDGNVTKIKLMTGTLYLYKGKRPYRAEFVRSK
jgi:hypothetical protein